MIISPRGLFIITTLAASIIGACQTTKMTEATPAILKSADDQSSQAVKSVLAKAMNKTNVRLGASGITGRSITVLPHNLGPLEGHSTAMPTHFDIMMSGKACYLIRRDTGEKYPLKGVICRKAE